MTIRPGVDDVIGLPVPYGEEGVTSRGREMYARGSFRAADFIGLPVLYRHGEPIGHVRDAVDTPAGVVVAMRFASTARAVEVAQLVDERAVVGLSVGFTEDTPAMRSKDGRRLVVTRGRPAEVTVTPTPAYRAARVLGVEPGADPNPAEEAA